MIPGILRSSPELFETYGRVAMTCGAERFESYVAALGIWLDIGVYCPQKGHFVAIFDNIAERKLAEEALKKSLNEKRCSCANPTTASRTTW